MSGDAEIRKEAGPSKGRYVLTEQGAEAELTYSVISPTKIIADHTGVAEAQQGGFFGKLMGAGKRLVAHMVEDARANGFSVIALCPFVAAMARRHPEWSDVFV